MSKKTLALIVGLIVLTLALLFVALNQGKTPTPSSKPGTTPTASPSPTPPAYTTLEMTPNPVTLGANGTGSVDVTINTESNEVQAVQLEIAYDPKMITGVDITAGSFFPNPVPIIKTIDTQTGRVTFALGITPAQNPVKGQGTVATLTFRQVAGASGQTKIDILPKSLIGATGVTGSSVLKSASGTTVQLSGNAVQTQVSPTQAQSTTPTQ